MKSLVLVLVWLTTFATLAVATEAVELRTQLVAEVRETTGPSERPVFRLVPATRLSQGQVVYYTDRITNPTFDQLKVRGLTPTQRDEISFMSMTPKRVCSIVSFSPPRTELFIT